MAKAKIIPQVDFRQFVERVAAVSFRPAVDTVVMALSFKAGLRASEIAGLKWENVYTPFGKIVKPGDIFEVPNDISKKGNGRLVPMNSFLHEALTEWHDQLEARMVAPSCPVVPTRKTLKIGVHNTPNTMQKYINRLYRNAKLNGVTSHSGRRTLITTMLRKGPAYDCSIRDAQIAVGHKHLSTTEAYVEPSAGVKKLISDM